MVEIQRDHEETMRKLEATIREEEEVVAPEMIDDVPLDQANAQSHTEH